MDRIRYLRRAEYVDRLAADAAHDRERKLLRQVADEWRKLAEEAARLAAEASGVRQA